MNAEQASEAVIKNEVVQPMLIEGRMWHSKSQTATLIGISKSTLDRWVAAGKFPRGSTRGGRDVYFRSESIVSWSNDQEGVLA